MYIYICIHIHIYIYIYSAAPGTLCAPIMKGGKQLQRKMNGDF